jgi:chaperonin GroEL (HSP60 family)
MKAFEKKVKGLIEKLKKERNAFNKEIGTESMVFIYDNIISDLRELLGEER